jgi:FAD-dependent urate hydroxylase
MENLKIVIIGAGIGGLTAGLALRQAGYQVEIYDRIRQVGAAGAAISIWSNGVKVMNRLGLGREIAQIGGRMERMTYYSATGELLTDFSLYPLVERVGQCPYPVTRADLQAMLLQAIGPEQVHLGAKCVAVEQDEDSVTALFEDGRRATGDLLIGADGTHSIVRQYVIGYPIERRYVGYVNWNGLITASEDLSIPNSWVIYVGEHKRASMMPVAPAEGRADNPPRFYFFLDVPLPKGTSSQPETYQAELAELFQGWAPPIQTLIQRLDPFKTNRIEIHDIDPLPTWTHGKAALLGDACHTSSPDLGQGGCQAMEDALVLANTLVSTNISIEDALKRYAALRRSRTDDIILRARKRADMIHGKNPDSTQKWYDELRCEDGTGIMNGICKTILAGPLN